MVTDSRQKKAPRSIRRKYDLQTLEQAITAVKEKGFSIRGAEKAFGVPYKTLRDHVYGISTSNKRGPRPKPKEPESDEEDLEKPLKKWAIWDTV